MGAICPKGFSTSMSIEINASADVIWSTISDVESSPNYMKTLKSVIIPKKINNNTNNNNDCFKEGYSWLEILLVGRKEVKIRKHITSIGTNIINITNNDQVNELHQQKYVRLYLSYPESMTKRNVQNSRTFFVDSFLISESANNNSNKIIDHSNNNNICTLKSTWALIPHAIFFQIYVLMYRKPTFQQVICTKIELELNEIAKEAERRYEILQNETIKIIIIENNTMC